MVAGHTFFRVAGSVLLLAMMMLGACLPPPGPGPIIESPLPTPARTDLSTDDDAALLVLPAAFRFELALRPAAMPDEPATLTFGQYREGAWAQTTAHGQDATEELLVAPDRATATIHSYTRSAGSGWTRWPGVGFDAGYGLTSPFAVLRLYGLADETAIEGVDANVAEAEPLTKVQAVFSPDTIRRLLTAGVATVTADAETRAALSTQTAGLLTRQTITYWVSKSGAVHQAAATLLTVDENNAPQPWLEVTWHFSAYNDPGIVVEAPVAFSDVADLAGVPTGAPVGAPVGADEAATESERTVALDPGATLRIRVFENAGMLAPNATVTVYAAGKRQAIDERDSADAQFALPPGTYDVTVRTANAEQRVEGIVTLPEGLASRDVVFDFGELEITVLQDDALPAVDIVVYPAGQREIWADYRSENPALIRVPAGLYDIEVGLPDLSGVKTLNNVTVRSSETVRETIDLGP